MICYKLPFWEERFQEMMMMYSCAIKAVKTKLQVLNDELSMTRKRNPIEFIETRVKRPDSIATKLKKKHLPISVESVRSNLNDVAGVRVICAFLDDIYKVADMLTAQDDVELIKTKDYIKKSPPDHIGAGVFFRSQRADPGGSADPYHCHGFLGQLRTPG